MKFNKDYSWVKIEGDVATLGVTKEAAKQVQEFVFVMLPKVGNMIKKDEVYVTLEAVKWSGHLTSPVTGEVVEANQVLFDEPALINRNPFDSWIVKIKLSDKTELDDLMNEDEALIYYQEKTRG